MNNIFLHGTLRRGCKDNGLIAAGSFFGLANTVQHYALCLVNEKPLVTKLPASTIKGEIYSVTDEMLALVDRLLGHPRVNRRELVSVTLEDGKTIEAWLYFYIQPLHNPTPIESGEYIELKR